MPTLRRRKVFLEEGAESRKEKKGGQETAFVCRPYNDKVNRV